MHSNGKTRGKFSEQFYTSDLSLVELAVHHIAHTSDS